MRSQPRPSAAARAAAALLLALCCAAAVAPRAAAQAGGVVTSKTSAYAAASGAPAQQPPVMSTASASASTGSVPPGVAAAMAAGLAMPMMPPGMLPPGAMMPGPMLMPNAAMMGPGTAGIVGSSVTNAAATSAPMGVSSAGASATARSGGGGGGPGAAGACRTLTETESSSCANGNCCAVKQRVTVCPDHTTAVAEINGVKGSCCVVLVNKRTGSPSTFCATPMKQLAAHQFPGGGRATVSINPECATVNGALKPALSCSVRFEKLPYGYTLPKGPATFAAGAAPWSKAAPCGNGAYGQLYQSTSVDKATRATTFTVKCQ